MTYLKNQGMHTEEPPKAKPSKSKSKPPPKAKSKPAPKPKSKPPPKEKSKPAPKPKSKPPPPPPKPKPKPAKGKPKPKPKPKPKEVKPKPVHEKPKHEKEKDHEKEKKEHDKKSKAKGFFKDTWNKFIDILKFKDHYETEVEALSGFQGANETDYEESSSEKGETDKPILIQGLETIIQGINNHPHHHHNPRSKKKDKNEGKKHENSYLPLSISFDWPSSYVTSKEGGDEEEDE